MGILHRGTYESGLACMLGSDGFSGVWENGKSGLPLVVQVGDDDIRSIYERVMSGLVVHLDE